MKSEHLQQLSIDFPYLFSLESDGVISVGDGWFHIIYELCARIMNELCRIAEDSDEGILPSFEVVQVKEKFGTLRFYYTGYRNETIFTLVADAEEQSETICEETGQPGSLHVRENGTWLRTLSEEKARELGFRKVINHGVEPWITLVTRSKD